MKQIIKEALDEVKKEKLKLNIFRLLDSILSIHKKEEYPASIFFAGKGNDKYYVMEYEKKTKHLYWHHAFWLNFFSYLSMGRSECEVILKEWVEKTLNCEVVRIIYELGRATKGWKRP